MQFSGNLKREEPLCWANFASGPPLGAKPAAPWPKSWIRAWNWPRSHCTRKQIWEQISVQTLWCVNTPIYCSVFHHLHARVARCSASCVNGAPEIHVEKTHFYQFSTNLLGRSFQFDFPIFRNLSGTRIMYRHQNRTEIQLSECTILKITWFSFWDLKIFISWRVLTKILHHCVSLRQNATCLRFQKTFPYQETHPRRRVSLKTVASPKNCRGRSSRNQWSWKDCCLLCIPREQNTGQLVFWSKIPTRFHMGWRVSQKDCYLTLFSGGLQSKSMELGGLLPVVRSKTKCGFYYVTSLETHSGTRVSHKDRTSPTLAQGPVKINGDWRDCID